MDIIEQEFFFLSMLNFSMLLSFEKAEIQPRSHKVFASL